MVTGQTVYTYTNIGLAGTTTYYYVVTAKNAGGETPSTVASAETYRSSQPGCRRQQLLSSPDLCRRYRHNQPANHRVWTLDKTAIDYNTGLRPLAAEVTAFPVTQLVLPYLPVPSTIDPLYYEQKSINTWQGEWAKGKATPQNVTAKWGDNLLQRQPQFISQDQDRDGPDQGRDRNPHDGLHR